jgi:hypothetical protein
MAKELPYFKFEPSEWLEGEIQILSDSAIACFINLCSGYWLKLGCISYAFALHKYCRKDTSVIQELITNNIIQVVDDEIQIKFLDSQLKEVNKVSKKRSQAAQKRWNLHTDNQEVNANALQVHSKSNAIREEKRREEKIIEDNIIKENSIDRRKQKFASTLNPFLEKYGKEFLNNFFKYWTEPNKSNSKFRQELEKTWSLERRLENWAKNEKNFKTNNKLQTTTADDNR